MQARVYKPSGMFSRFRGLALPIGFVLFKTPSFLLIFSLRWVVLGISCHVPFVLFSRVWRPLFIFLHLYLGPCSRDVGVYFPLSVLALCMMYLYIYLLVHFRCDCHSLCHLRQSDALFLLRKKGDTLPDFHRGNLVLCPNALGKHRLGPHPFKSQTSKPPCMQSPKSQCQSYAFTANLWKLRFSENKRLSLDRRCGVPNTFSTHNQTSRPKNQDFFHPH